MVVPATGGVKRYHTLLCAGSVVQGGAGSRASVVAPSACNVWLKGVTEILTASAKLSFEGAAAIPKTTEVEVPPPGGGLKTLTRTVPTLATSAAEIEAAAHHGAAANARERGHIAACRAWLDGDWRRAVRSWGDVLLDHPRDTLALQLAHIGDFFLGQSQMLRDRVARVLPYWRESTPGFGYVLGMHAFGLEETGDYARAEQAGRQALELNARDPWAVHAVAHVMEMQGRLADGIAWLESRAPDWSPDNGFAYHNWWHLALYYLDLGEHAKVLELYDTRIRPGRSQVILEMIDASAMLWRLHLRGVDVGNRWEAVARNWEPVASAGNYAFNDLHAMMAYVGTGRSKAADAVLGAQRAAMDAPGDNAQFTREVGYAATRAIKAFGDGDFAETVRLLRPIRSYAHRFGGSHAQRDLLDLTLIEAASRAGQDRLAAALRAERMNARRETIPAKLKNVRARRLAAAS